MTGHNELQCEIHPFGTLSPLRFVVICSFYRGKYLLSYHSSHQSWETQGGHIEMGESPEEAARRELYEESGVQSEQLIPVCDYFAYDSEGSANGRVYGAVIDQLGDLPSSEMSKIQVFSTLPDNMTYPLVTPKLFEETKKRLKAEKKQADNAVDKELKAFLNDKGQIKAIPSKRKKKLKIYWYLAEKIEPLTRYSEKEINDLLDNWSESKDHATLRRELYDHMLLHRTDDGKTYWRDEKIPAMEEFVSRYS